LGTAAAALFPASQTEVFSQANPGSHADQVVRADQVGLELGELAFMKGGKLLKQELARDQAKHRITQELKLLIIEFFHCSFRAACLGLFMGMRAMRKRAFQHLRMLEAMAQRGL